ncbi:MAG: hypothetical protein ACOZDY_20450 [Pseudomonadota bacterium]
MNLNDQPVATERYAKCVEVSKRIRFDIDRDVFRGRDFDYTRKFLPEGLSKAAELEFLSGDEQRLLSQIQGRSYANIFALVERFIAAKVLEVSGDHVLGDQAALVRFGDEEIKHQVMFRRLDRMMEAGMPAGYEFLPDANEVARVVLSKSEWAVLGLICHIELFVLAHYRSSIDPVADICPLWNDVFLHHWREESQHAIIDELEWKREDARLTAEERDRAVDDLIELVGAVDGILQAQSLADATYFIEAAGRRFSAEEARRVRNGVLKAYRWQYIVSGVQEPRFQEILGGLIDDAQAARIGAALAPIVGAQ